jgi:homoserine kinase
LTGLIPDHSLLIVVMTMKIQVRVPATSANLGPGFDCMGLALNLWNHFAVEELPDGARIEVENDGEGAEELPRDRSHLVLRTMLTELAHLTGDATWYDRPPALRLVCRNAVPAGSGLGSSSTAVLGGLLLAHAYYGRRIRHTNDIDRDAVLYRAIEHEGHGDNVAPALLGGLVLVSSVDGPAVVRRLSIPTWQVVVCVPTYHFLTSTARAALPTQYSKQDAIYNVGHALLVMEALRTGDHHLLGQAIRDRLHVPYRLPLIPGARDACRAAIEQGASAATISGAGPGLIAFAQERHAPIGVAMVQAFADARLSARYWVLETIDTGAESVDNIPAWS